MYKIINKDYLTTQFNNFFKAIEGIFSRQGHKHTKSDITDLTIPTQLSELSDDSTHRLVTDTEKSAWNNKSDFSGDYNDLDNKPTIPSISGLATVTQVETAEDNANGYTDQKIADLINGAPSTLDTLKEIADAMTTQSSVVEALDKAIGTKQDKITETNKLSYNLLSDTPNIPSEVTESTVSGWGFTKNSGTYSKPTNGIPKTDLDSSVQSSLGKADTALQSYTETDPTVPSWAKQPNKPSYTASEVGALPSDTKIPSKLSELSADTTHRLVTDTNITNWNNKAETSDIPTKTSQLTNDSGFLTSHQNISGKEDSSNKVSAWSTTTNNTHYPSEKLVKDSLDNKVDKVSGKGLSTNDFTTTYKTAIDNLPTSYAPTNAERNTIVGIQKNGTDLTIDSNRKVNITVPTQASDIGAMASTVTHLSGDVPTTRKVNNKALSDDITLTASDVGARASDWTPSKSDIGLGNVGNFKAVSTVANQGLTETEKANARANIGAGASSFSGSYNDLTDKPTIPTVNNATLTIQKNGTTVTTFTANASSNTTANITVPTKVSELTNDSGYLTSHQSLSDRAVNKTLTNENLNNVTTSGFYNVGGGNSVTNKPSGVDYFGLIVVHDASGAYYTQKLFTDTTQYTRKCVNGTWKSWSEDKLTDTNTWRGIQDNLTSDSATDSLSAKQGKALKALIDGKQDAITSSNKLAYSLISGTPTIPTSLPANGGTATYAELLKPHHANYGSTLTTSQSTWRGNITDGEVVWGQKFKDTKISTDTGDISLWLSPSGTNATLNMSIDGNYYAAGNNIVATQSWVEGKGYKTTDNDTKNTAGSTDTSSKIFLIGATSQGANPQTYSDNEVYVTNGVLTTKSVQVGGTKATMQYNTTNECIDFIFS